MKPEDIIVAMNGKPIKDGDDLVNRVADTPVGSEVTITVDRAGQKLDKKLTIGDRTQVFANDPRFRDDRPKRPAAEGRDAGEVRHRTSATSPMPSGRPKNFEDKQDKRGVIVTRVEPDSFAEEIGIRENDIIVSINRQPVATVEDVRRLQANLKDGDAVAFRIMRAIPGATHARREGRPGRACLLPGPCLRPRSQTDVV